MCSGRDGLERLGGVLELHRVALLRAEIDGQLADQEIDGLHAAEAPAFVVAKAAGQELFEGLARLGGKFAGVNGFLDFGIHRGAGQDKGAVGA